MLQRIYGISFDSEEKLQEFLKRREEAKRRDHRRLGRELDLFSLHEERSWFSPSFTLGGWWLSMLF